MTDRDRAISPQGSPLRRRMIEDMEVRGFTAKTQIDYIRAVRDFTCFFGRAPRTSMSSIMRWRNGLPWGYCGYNRAVDRTAACSQWTKPLRGDLWR